MRQLVGCPCALCQGTVDSIVEGGFCADCGNPVHRACVAPRPPAAGKCPVCGASLSDPLGAEVLAERRREARQARGGKYPVSRACPACGAAAFTPASPDRWIAFTHDRVCRACGTRWPVRGPSRCSAPWPSSTAFAA